jgi:hypothetical protein
MGTGEELGATIGVSSDEDNVTRVEIGFMCWSHSGRVRRTKVPSSRR